MLSFFLSWVVAGAAFARSRVGPDTNSPAHREHRLGGKGQPKLFDDALLTGVVPAGAARPAWIKELRGKNDPPPTVLQRILDVVIFACVGWGVIDFARTASLKDVLIPLAVMGGILLLIGVWILIERHRKADKIDQEARLLEVLERQAVAYDVVKDLRSPRRSFMRTRD
jgi:hypothetical protein